MNRSPAEVRDRWLNYGRRYARWPTLHDSSVACMFGPLAPEGGTFRDYARGNNATWSVGAGDVPKYAQESLRGQAFWAGQYDGSNDYADASSASPLIGATFSVSGWAVYSGPHPSDVYRTLIAKSETTNGNNDHFNLFVVNSDGKLYARVGYGTGQSSFVSIAAVPVNTPFAFALTYSSVAGTGDLWVNGVSQNPKTGLPTAYTSGTYFNLGRWRFDGSGYGEWASQLAALAVRNRILTANEIQILARHPLAAYTVDVPKYWSFAPSTHLWPWQIRRSRRVRGHR